MTDTSNMPRYVSHKRVHALEIKEVRQHYHSSGEALVKFSDDSTRVLSPSLFTRYIPIPGDFYVVYEDGYESFSPRQAFLDGYTIDPSLIGLQPRDEGQSFADIKQEINRGKADTDKA